MDLSALTRSEGPWMHRVSGTPSQLSQISRSLEETSGRRRVARTIRGSRCKTKAALLDECAAALQFPLTFGDNWDALHDALCDLAWLGGEGIILLVAEADHLLSSSSEEFAKFLAILDSVHKHSTTKTKTRAARTFHVAFHASSGHEAALAARLPAGVALANLA